MELHLDNMLGISIHAPHAGRDPIQQPIICLRLNFNPRAPRGARQIPDADWFAPEVFQSTRPTRGATRQGERRPDINCQVEMYKKS